MKRKLDLFTWKPVRNNGHIWITLSVWTLVCDYNAIFARCETGR